MPKINLAFDVFSAGDPYTIKVGDFSDWLTIKNLPAQIEIKLPGSNEPLIYAFVKYSINSFNSTTFYNNCSECEDNPAPLADGIYSFTLRGAGGYNKQKYYLKTDVLELDLDKMIIDLGFSYTDTVKSKMEHINKIKFYLESAKSNTKLGYIKDANLAYSEAQKLMNCKECHNR